MIRYVLLTFAFFMLIGATQHHLGLHKEIQALKQQNAHIRKGANELIALFERKLNS